MLRVDWEFYAAEYLGKMNEQEFKRQEPKAAAYVAQVTQGRDLPEEAGSRAVCAVADIMARYEERAGIASESNDGISVSYADGTSAGAMRECLQAVSLYLGGTGLLYRGIGGTKC